MFGKMKKMFKDEDAGAILGAASGSLLGVIWALIGSLFGGCGGAICGAMLPCGPVGIGPFCTGPLPWGALCGTVCGGAVAGVLGTCVNCLGGGIIGIWIDYILGCCTAIPSTIAGCCGVVASCINFVPSLMGGLMGGK